MTPEQILGIADAALNAPATAPRVEPPKAPTAPVIGDDDIVTGGQLRQILEAAARPDAGVALAASAIMDVARSKHARDFERYGPEINALVDRIPLAQRTLDNIAQVVRMVRSDHVEDLAHERAQELLHTMPPALRSTGAAAPAAPATREVSLESDKIPQDWKDRARAAGITEEVVRDFARANDMTVEAFYKQFDTPRNPIVQDISVGRRS